MTVSGMRDWSKRSVLVVVDMVGCFGRGLFLWREMRKGDRCSLVVKMLGVRLLESRVDEWQLVSGYHAGCGRAVLRMYCAVFSRPEVVLRLKAWNGRPGSIVS